MNIVFLFHSPIIPQNGGVQRVTSLIGTELSNRGHNVYYLMNRKAQIETRYLWPEKQYVIDCSNKTEKDIINYHTFLRQNSIDIVISQKADDISLFLLEHTPLDIRKISVYHIQPFPFLNMERAFKRNLISHDIARKITRLMVLICPYLYRKRIISNGKKQFHKIAKVSDKIVLLSEKFYFKILTYTNVPLAKLAAINNPNTFKSPILDKNINKENLLIYVGRLENTQKNIIGFVEMWRIYSKNHPNWNAQIIGEGKARKDIEKYIEKHQIERISLEGLQKDVESYYRRAKFICLTSHFEGWGMVLTEGMSYGCVPVCFDSYESCHDIISDGNDGIIVRPFDNSEMAFRISEVANNKTKYDAMSQQAIKKVTKFNIAHIVDQWENLFNKI